MRSFFLIIKKGNDGTIEVIMTHRKGNGKCWIER